MSSLIKSNLANNTKKVLIALSLASSGLLFTSLINNAWANITMPIEGNSMATEETPNSSLSATNDKSTAVKETQIKEKGKVYRDPFGNVIAAPIKKGESQNSQTTEPNLQESQDKIKPTSSIGMKKSSLLSADSDNSNKTESLDSDSKRAKLNIAVVYFSVPENTTSQDVDVLSGASKILTKENQEQGIVEYIAKLINQEMQGQLFELKGQNDYPQDHSKLIEQTALEKDDSVRPNINLNPEFDPSTFDVIFIGYPIWWHDLPMPLYSFFDKYDLSGKTIIPFCTHGGNRPYKTFALISHIEPNAQVILTNGLVLNRSKVAQKGQATVEKWLNKIKTNVLEPKYGHLQPIENRQNGK